MSFDFVLHEEQITANSPPDEGPVLAKTDMESGPRSRYDVFDVFDLSYGGISVIAVNKMRDSISLIWIVLVRLDGIRRGTGEEWTLCALARGSA